MMCNRMLLLAAIMPLLAACTAVPHVTDVVEPKIAQFHDTSLLGAEKVICDGISVGAWRRRYGNSHPKARAWLELCSEPAGQITPSGSTPPFHR